MARANATGVRPAPSGESLVLVVGARVPKLSLQEPGLAVL